MKRFVLLILVVGILGALQTATASANGATVWNQTLDSHYCPWAEGEEPTTGVCVTMIGDAQVVFAPSGMVNSYAHIVVRYDRYVDGALVQSEERDYRRKHQTNKQGRPGVIHDAGTITTVPGCTIRYNVTGVNGEVKHEFYSECE